MSGGNRPPNNDPCITLEVINRINALQADADVCAQQETADTMIDFAKSSGVTNMQALINNAITYCQQPRNVVVIQGVTPQTLFCTKLPRNVDELGSVSNAQLPGTSPGLFGSPSTGIVAFGGRE